MSELKHTFAVCAYMENPYLEEAVRSVVNQTIKSDVYISTGTPNSYISNIAAKYNIPVLVNDAKDADTGTSNANFAIRSAKTEFITIVHQDDVYEPQYAEEVLQAADGHNPIIVFTEYYELRNGKRVYSNRLLRVKRLMNIGFRVFPHSRFVRKRVLSFGCSICCPAVTFSKKKCDGFEFDKNYKCITDWDAWIRLSELKGDFICVNKPLMGHRIHEGSSTTETLSNGIRHNETFEIYKRFWPEWFAKRLIKMYEIGDKSNDL